MQHSVDDVYKQIIKLLARFNITKVPHNGHGAP